MRYGNWSAKTDLSSSPNRDFRYGWAQSRPTQKSDAFDPAIGLYRGETSFLDWREQNYPAWTAKDTTWIAQSFALSTNVLHYEALRLAERMARERKDTRTDDYAREADALRTAIDRRFWREDRGLRRTDPLEEGVEPEEAEDLSIGSGHS